MKALIILLLLLPVRSCLMLDIVLLVDISDSVSGHELFIRDAVLEFSEKFEGTTVNISTIVFSNSPKVINHLGEKNEFVFETTGATYISEGINTSIDELFTNGRIGYKKMIILISDGDASDYDLAEKAVLSAKAMSVSMIGVLIQSGDANEKLFENFDLYVRSDYETLAEELLKMNFCF